MATQKHTLEHVLQEKERVGKLAQIRELVFGAQDGLLVPLGVVSSVAGAFSDNHIVLIAGISEALAGAFSMATGAFLASQAEKQVFINEINKERKEMADHPKYEREEMILLYKNEGMSEEDAQKIVEILLKNKSSYFTNMVQKELGIDPDLPSAPIRDAVLVGLSYMLAAIVPLFPYFLISGMPAIVCSILATFVALFCIGLAKGKVASLPYIKSGLQVLLIGAGAGIGGYLLGTILPHLLGIK
ncbi:MAG TPA: VIT1/CCC1 transporter family protein [Patescibacteria group bacterium]|nr:VIT1/CCC1 transporter family protein [Patescibacteria group bacterium]